MNPKPPECQGCPRFSSGRGFVPFDGPLDAELLLVGEQPGEQEIKEGKPFVGPSGKVLEKALARVGWLREKVMIANIRCCAPPLAPESPKIRAESIAYCTSTFLQKTLDKMSRLVHIHAIGSDASGEITGLSSSVKTHGSHWSKREILAMKAASGAKASKLS